MTLGEEVWSELNPRRWPGGERRQSMNDCIVPLTKLIAAGGGGGMEIQEERSQKSIMLERLTRGRDDCRNSDRGWALAKPAGSRAAR